MEVKDFAIIPFNSTTIKDKYLVSNALGGWDVLTKEEFDIFNSFSVNRDSPLFNRFYEKKLLLDENNLQQAVSEYKRLNINLFTDTSLHIAVLTTRCNLSCVYCQTRTLKSQDMSHEVASRVLNYIFSVKTPYVTLEFQGGEPLLNWDVLAFTVEHARKFNTHKNLKIALVTNLTLMDEAKMKFLTDFDVEICTSLDGPKDIHDKNRVFTNGKGTYDTVVKNISKLHKKFGRRVNLLPTVTKHTIKNFKGIIDEYVKWGEPEISLRPVNEMGFACSNWKNIGYSPKDFESFYKNSLDYILSLNKKGIFIRERMARVILQKIIAKRDPVYVELMNPCGAGRSTISYMPDGTCYPCDEARMVGEDMFKLGNILNEDYEDLMKKENLMHILEASLINLWDYSSAFSPWMGTCPVVNYALQNNIVPKIHCSFMHKIYNFQFRYIFEKIIGGGKDSEILKGWVKKGG